MTRSERIVSLVILTALLCSAAAVGLYRFKHSPRSGTLTNLLPNSLPAGWRTLGQAEEYPAYRLSEKINGEDMVYLSRGCLGLAWNAYGSTANEDFSIQLSIYDMANTANASNIYEHVRGPWGKDLEAVDLGDEAYFIMGSLFFRSGRYYIKLQGSANDPAVGSACKAMAKEISKNLEQKTK